MAKGSEGLAYAWTPDAEAKALQSIAAEAASPSHLYGTDEDAGFGASVSIPPCRATIRPMIRWDGHVSGSR